MTETPSARDPRTETPLDRDPPTETAPDRDRQTKTPQDGDPLDRDRDPPVNRQTPVKT